MPTYAIGLLIALAFLVGFTTYHVIKQNRRTRARYFLENLDLDDLTPNEEDRAREVARRYGLKDVLQEREKARKKEHELREQRSAARKKRYADMLKIEADERIRNQRAEEDVIASILSELRESGEKG